MVGNSNQLAYAASLSIAENPSGSFNPLFIYGGAGLGKTHLIQAIGQAMREKNSRFKIVYMSAESFVTEVITSIRYDRMQQFRDRYRSVDAGVHARDDPPPSGQTSPRIALHRFEF